MAKRKPTPPRKGISPKTKGPAGPRLPAKPALPPYWPARHDYDGAEEACRAIELLMQSVTAQRERLSARDWTPEQMAQRNAAQMPVAEKMQRSNYVVWSEGGLDVHAQQWARILPTD